MTFAIPSRQSFLANKLDEFDMMLKEGQEKDEMAAKARRPSRQVGRTEDSSFMKTLHAAKSISMHGRRMPATPISHRTRSLAHAKMASFRYPNHSDMLSGVPGFARNDRTLLHPPISEDDEEEGTNSDRSTKQALARRARRSLRRNYSERSFGIPHLPVGSSRREIVQREPKAVQRTVQRTASLSATKIARGSTLHGSRRSRKRASLKHQNPERSTSRTSGKSSGTGTERRSAESEFNNDEDLPSKSSNSRNASCRATSREMRRSRRPTQHQQRRPSNMMKEEHQGSSEFSRSSDNRDSTMDHVEKHDNTGNDNSEKLSAVLSPVSNIAKSKGIEEPKKRDPVRRQLNDMIMTPRNALLRRGRSMCNVNVMKSMRITPYSSNSSRKPLIDSKKKIISSRIAKGLLRRGKERDDDDSDEISIDVNFNDIEDDDVDDEHDRKQKKHSPKSDCDEIEKVPGMSGDKVKDENEDTNKLNSFVKTKDKGKWDLKSRFKKSLKQEDQQTTQYGLMMSTTSFSASFSANFSANFSDDDTKDLADHYGGELKDDQQIEGNNLQIDFSYLSNSGTGDLFVESIETDDAQSMETHEAITKYLSNHTKNTDDDPNESMDVLVPCSSPSLSPNSRARAA